jgi:hypothetical protein
MTFYAEVIRNWNGDLTNEVADIMALCQMEGILGIRYKSTE